MTVSIYVNVYYVWMRAYVYIYRCVCLCVQRNICMYIYTHIHTYTHTYMDTYIHSDMTNDRECIVNLQIYLHTYIRMYIHIYIHTNIHINFSRVQNTHCILASIHTKRQTYEYERSFRVQQSLQQALTACNLHGCLPCALTAWKAFKSTGYT
jgi:hypothetical protein